MSLGRLKYFFHHFGRTEPRWWCVNSYDSYKSSIHEYLLRKPWKRYASFVSVATIQTSQLGTLLKRVSCLLGWFIWTQHIYQLPVSKLSSLLGWFIWTQHIDQLPVGLLAQLVKRFPGIAEVMGSNPVRAFFQVLFSTTRLVFLAARIS